MLWASCISCPYLLGASCPPLFAGLLLSLQRGRATSLPFSVLGSSLPAGRMGMGVLGAQFLISRSGEVIHLHSAFYAIAVVCSFWPPEWEAAMMHRWGLALHPLHKHCRRAELAAISLCSPVLSLNQDCEDKAWCLCEQRAVMGIRASISASLRGWKWGCLLAGPWPPPPF